MSVEFVIIYGVLVGFIASKIWGSGFGLWWDIYLGVAGAAFGSCIMVVAYFMNVSATQDIIGLNLYSVTVDIVGALIFIYTAKFYYGAVQLSIRLYDYGIRHKLARRIGPNIIPSLFSEIKTPLIIKKVAGHTYA